MSAEFRGNYTISAPNEIRYSFVPFRGWQTVWVYRSKQELIFTLSIEFEASNSGASLELVRVDQSPLWQLTVTFDYRNDGVSVEKPVNTWELLGNDVQKSIYEHPTTLALGIDTITAVKVAIQSVSAASPGEEQAAKAAAIANIRKVAGANGDVAEELFTLIYKETTHFSVSEFVLRHTQTVSNSYLSQFSLDSIEYLYTTEQLIAESSIPSSVVFDLSSIAEPAEKPGYLWTWLKRSPQIQFVAGAKIQVTQEYWLDQWSTYLYFTKI